VSIEPSAVRRVSSVEVFMILSPFYGMCLTLNLPPFWVIRLKMPLREP
jgi:hypothetical protein